MRAAAALVLLLGCREARDAPAPAPAAAVRVPDDAAIDAAPPPRTDGVVLVVTLADRAYVPLAGWMTPLELEPVEAWGSGDVTQVEAGRTARTYKLQAATRAPVAAIGARVVGYQADGAACPTAIDGLFLLGYSNGTQLWDDSEVYLVGRLAPTPGCAPLLVTDRPDPLVFAPAPPPSAALARTLAARFRALPAYRPLARAHHWSGAPRIELFAARDGARRAIVSMDSAELTDDCTGHLGGLRAAFSLDGAAPTLAFSIDEPFLAPTLALLDSDRDGALELVIGPADFDHGMNVRTSAASSYDAGPERAGPLTDVSFSNYAGCD